MVSSTQMAKSMRYVSAGSSSNATALTSKKSSTPLTLSATILESARWKVTTSDGFLPAEGRLNPITNQPLFTADMKNVIENVKPNAEGIQDKVPPDEIYCHIPPNPNSEHSLPEWQLLHGELKQESFHSEF